MVPFPVGLMSSSGFNPAVTANVAYYNPKVTVFQLSNGTTAVGNGDPVGYYGDLTGNGRHIIQATSGDRPVYNTTGLGGSSPSIDFTHSSAHWMYFTAGVDLSGTSSFWWAFVMSVNGVPLGGAIRIISMPGVGGSGFDYANGGARVQVDGDPTYPVYAGHNTSFDALDSRTYTSGTRFRYIGQFNGSTYVSTFNGVDGAGTATSGAFPSSAKWALGTSMNTDGSEELGTGFHINAKYGPVLMGTGTLSAGTKSALDAWLAAY
jgi:hypothetical protein